MGYSMYNKKADAKDKKFLKELIELAIKNVMSEKENHPEIYKKCEIKNFGRLLEGEGYYHEVDKYYRLVGFEIEVERQYDFQDDSKTKVGFYALWMGKTHQCSPFTFEESYREIGQSHKFENGLGDHVEVMEELASIQEVQDFIQENGIMLM